jgi:hypothetical protein
LPGRGIEEIPRLNGFVCLFIVKNSSEFTLPGRRYSVRLATVVASSLWIAAVTSRTA